MDFRHFKCSQEERNAENIIMQIDRGECWIFKGADDSEDFGGFIHRLYFQSDNTFGVFCACVFCDNLRFIIGFNDDIPEYLEGELIDLIVKTREQKSTRTSIWYPPENSMLDTLLREKLPWKGRGHKTRELTFTKPQSVKTLTLPNHYELHPFNKDYLDTMCKMLDESLAHTYSNPHVTEYTDYKNEYCKEWLEKATIGECTMLMQGGNLLGAYILKGAEIDIMAVKTTHQGKGLGRYLLHHAAAHVLGHHDILPHLYCIDSNQGAIRFYLREGMEVTGHSGCLFWNKI